MDPKQVRLDERSGSITLHARAGRSLDVGALRDALAGSRLFPRRGLRVNYLELTVAGRVALAGGEINLRVPGAKQQFVVAPTPGAAEAQAPFRRLRDVLSRGQQVTSVTGRVEGWSGGELPPARAEAARPVRLLLTGFETSPK